jgi:hypothetical protein
MHKRYICLQLASQKIYISRHVLFHESIFSFKNLVSSPEPSPISLLSQSLTILPLSNLSLLHISSPPATLSSSSPTISSSHHMMRRRKINSLKPKSFSNHQVYNITTTVCDEKKENKLSQT